jgi:hypothetical protein
MQSVKNQTTVPLRAGAIFIGGWEDVLDYGGAMMTIVSDQYCEIEFYTSNDKNSSSVKTIEYTASNTIVTTDVALQSRYVYVTVRNTSGSNQTLLNFSMLYKNYPAIPNTRAQNVNISSGSIGNTGFNVNNFPQGTTQLWDAATLSNTDTSAVISLNTTACKQVTFFGNTSDTVTLTVQFSNDGTTFYSSEYNVALIGATDSGFTVSSSAFYVRLIASNIATSPIVTAFANYS